MNDRRTPSTSAERAPHSLDETTWGGGPASVWMLEDSPLEMDHAVRALSPACLVRGFSEGEALLEALASEAPPDMLILDWELPGLSGVEVCGFVRESRTQAELPIVMLTSHRDHEDLATALSAGANDYVRKPYDGTELFARVAASMRTRRLFERANAAARELAHERRRVDESEARYRRLSESGVIGIIETDLHGNVYAANDVYLDLVGYTRADLAAGRLQSFEVTSPENRLANERATADLFEHGIAAAREVTLRRSDGTSVSVSIASVRLSPTSDRCVAYVLDISARTYAEADRQRLYDSERQARQDAEAASRMKDDFLATVSHELRTPLNAILGWTSLLLKTPDDVLAVTNGLARVERNARAQAKLIDDILDVSRIIAGKVRLDIAPVDLRAVIEHAIDAVRPAALAKNISLELQPFATGRRLHADGARLEQVVWNLLSNAIKFTPTGGVVRVEHEPKDGHVEIRVTDTGAGIPSSHLLAIFERFRQVDASTTRAHGGLGLGLAIVRHLVELHGGSACASSAGEGRGATFTVRLPIARDRTTGPGGIRIGPEIVAATSARQEQGPLHGSRVLVVDDEEDSREFLCVLLRRAGADVVSAASAREAMTLFGACRPSILLSDIAMPEEDGHSLIQRIRALPGGDAATVPAVAITAYARVEDVLKARRSGFQQHIPKPVDSEALVSAMIELLHPAEATC